MGAYKIVCKNCSTEVARTPNGICIKCGAHNWGYSSNINTGQIAPQPVSQQNIGTKIVCKNCNTIVIKTADGKCLNCGRRKWGYTDAELNSGSITPIPSKRGYIKYVVGVVSILIIAVLGWMYFPSKINAFDKYHKSVVLLYSEFTYKITINNESVYFSYDEIENKIYDQTTYADSIKPMSLQGTGFFIDDKGRIVTNRHVAHHLSTKDEENCKITLSTYLQKKVDEFGSLKDNATNQMIIYTNEYSQYTSTGEIDEANETLAKLKTLRALQEYAEKSKNLYQGILNGLASAKFDVEILFIGYAIDGSTVRSKSDFKSCHLLNYSKDVDIDLAIIQSNDHKLPEGITTYIPINNSNERELKVGDEVSLIGYNMGTQIGSTKTGLHIQKMIGSVSQEPDGNKVLYSINSLSGSSGSPVFANDGTLVAVNFAGLNNTSGYNYGILAKHIHKLCE